MQRLLALAICFAIHLAGATPAGAARRSPHLASRARTSVRAQARRRPGPPRSPRAETLAAVDDAMLGAGEIALAQEILLRAGWLHGTADGRLTTRTRRALAALQRALHRPGTGALDAATYALLVAADPDGGPAAARPTPVPQLAIAPVPPISPSASAPPRRAPRRRR